MQIKTWCTQHLKLSLIALFVCAGSSFGQTDARLAFMSDRSGQPEIYVMNADGSAPVQVTVGEGNARNEWPTLSPGGEYIAYTGRRGGDRDIYRINIDGTNEVNLTDTEGADDLPAWSPDGTKIAFISSRDGNFEIYVMDADGSNLINLTQTEDIDEVRPMWSPDGTRILSRDFRDSKSDMFIVHADGSGVVKLTNDGGQEIDGVAYGYSAGAWSPDGTKIAYGLSTSSGGLREIWVMDADGTNRMALTATPDRRESAPTWSPDGRQIAYYALEGGPPDIWIMDADGGNQTNLTQSNTVVDVSPSFAAGLSRATLIEVLSWGRVKASVR